MDRQSWTGELAVSGTVDKFFIVRIAWVFGKNGKNFIKTMINLGKTHDTLSVVMTRSVHLLIPMTWQDFW